MTGEGVCGSCFSRNRTSRLQPSVKSLKSVLYPPRLPAKKPRCIQVEHLAILGAYETQTTFPDTGSWYRSGGIALGLVHRESNGGHAGDAQNGRDEFGWLLNGLFWWFF
jgi:hypothetical protein